MATTGGFAPGTYQAADLNRLQQIFGSPGIARGMVVTQTSPTGLSVLVGVDAVALDGVCYLPNGGWVRIDAALTLSVPSNGTGSTRNDAVVATMDPTGNSGAPTVAYITNWAGGFGGGNNNQNVLALVAVPNGASSVLNSNITVSTAAASFGNAKTAGTSNFVSPVAQSNSAYVPQVQTSTSGFGLAIIDNTSAPLVEVFPVAISGTARGLQLGYTDAANVLHSGMGVDTTGRPYVGATGGSTFLTEAMSITGPLRIFASSTTAVVGLQKYDLVVLFTTFS